MTASVLSKHLLEVGKTAFERPRNPFDAVHYDDGQTVADWAAAIEEKDRVVASLREQNYVDVAERFETEIYKGYGRFGAETTIEVVDGPDAGTTITGEKALVATGSSPQIAPIDGLEDVAFETSESILERRDLPESIVMIGGGFAMEWGQILHHMGTDVTILQRSSHVLSGMEGQLGRELQRCFEDEGITVVTDVDIHRVSEFETIPNGGVETTGRTITVETDIDGDPREFSASELFVATGVRPNTDETRLAEVDIETDDSGSILVDDTFRTTNPDVYAAGDCIGEPMLETVAAKRVHAVKNAFGNEGATIDYYAVPTVVFTSPEVAAVGTTELEYVDEHGTCSCRSVEMADVPKAKAVKDTRGLLQVVKHRETDEIVGVHVVAPQAADMIPAATLAMKFGLTVDDVIDTVHSFPTFSEALKHACQAFRRDTLTMSCCVE